MRRSLVSMALPLVALLTANTPSQAWDSLHKLSPLHPTHSYLTEFAIDALGDQFPELETYRPQLIEGANTELHELPVTGTAYGMDLDAKRIEHLGTNEGSNDVKGWWTDAAAAYAEGNKPKAYFLLGVLLHMVQDMGVPAHANRVYHQGTPGEFDNFEFLAFSNWKPSFAAIDKPDPAYAEPWRYYAFSEAWTHEDAPDYADAHSFSKFWVTAIDDEKALLSNRQGRTAMVVQWTLAAAARAFAD